MTEDEMVGWRHRLDGLEFEQAPGVGDGQARVACCNPWGRKESDTTEQLNNNNPLHTSNTKQTCFHLLTVVTPIVQNSSPIMQPLRLGEGRSQGNQNNHKALVTTPAVRNSTLCL